MIDLDRVQRILDSETGPYEAGLAVARIIVPYSPNTAREFEDTARYLLGSVITALMVMAPERWTMADVAVALQHWKTTKDVLRCNPSTAHIAEEFSGLENAHWADVLATIDA